MHFFTWAKVILDPEAGSATTRPETFPMNWHGPLSTDAESEWGSPSASDLDSGSHCFLGPLNMPVCSGSYEKKGAHAVFLRRTQNIINAYAEVCENQNDVDDETPLLYVPLILRERH